MSDSVGGFGGGSGGATSAGSGRRIRWGIIATGGIASAFASDLRELKDDAELVAVGSRSTGAARAFADRFDVPRAYGSWTALADDEDVDVVYIATPHSAHRVAAGLCLRAGRAVLCEKPLTVNAVEARELADLARGHGRFLMEAMWMYCSPVIRRLTALVADGAIGEVRAVHADFGLAGPFEPGHRLRDPAQAGGAVLDMGVYPVSFAHLLLGEPDEVQAWGHLTPEGVDDATGMVLGYDSGAMAVLSCSLAADTARTAVVTGTTGRIEFPRGFFYPEHFVLHREGSEPEVFGPPAAPAGGRLHGLQYEAMEVMRCLRAGETQSPLVPVEGSLAVMRTLDTVRDRIGVRYPGEA